MSQPLDRTEVCEPLGEIDEEAGEFWVNSPFQMPELGHNLSAYETNCLFINVKGKKFIDASFASQADLDADSRSAIAGDFDADGAPDLLVGSVGGGPLRMFLNRFPKQHHSVRLKLSGLDSNRPAIGAQVTLRCPGQTIVRDLFPANGFMGQSPAELLIGVGKAKTIDEIVIRWPNGTKQAYQDVPVDAALYFEEGVEGYRKKQL